MKKYNRRSFFAGALAALMAVCLVTPSLAALAKKTIDVYTGVEVYVNDQKVDPRDANGNPVEVFVYNGTTYLPIRAIGNALGVPVQWDGKSNSAFVGSHSGETPAVWVKDMDYFVGEGFVIENRKDNLGIQHGNAVFEGGENAYLINGQYSAISGTFFQLYEDRSRDYATTLEIYGDGELLYAAEMNTGIKPIDFYIDLTGVLELKIKLEDGDGDWAYYAGVADFGLWA